MTRILFRLYDLYINLRHRFVWPPVFWTEPDWAGCAVAWWVFEFGDRQAQTLH